jgi:hypothetical protein
MEDGEILMYVNDVRLALTAKPRMAGGVIFFPVQEVFEQMGARVTLRPGAADVLLWGRVISVSEDAVSVDAAPCAPEVQAAYIDGTLMLSLDVFRGMTEVKTVFDKAGNMVVFTTVDWQTDDTLYALNDRLYMSGEPFYELSFNRYSLFWQLLSYYAKEPESEEKLARAEETLSELHDAGFKTIRVLGSPWSGYGDIYENPQTYDAFVDAMDTMFDLCDKYDLRVVFCIACTPHFFTRGLDKAGSPYNEDAADLIVNPNSQSRRRLNRWTDEIVTRYKSRGTILMWEISNELNLLADIPGSAAPKTLLNMQNFFTDMSNRIRALDGRRLITTGDSITRDSQWNLYAHGSWTVDTAAERIEALKIINPPGIDVVSTHVYNVELGRDVSPKYDTGGRQYAPITFTMLANEARAAGKPLFVGEIGFTATSVKKAGESGENCATFADEEVVALMGELLDKFVASDIQYGLWWQYDAVLTVQPDMVVRKGYTDAALQKIIDANRAMKNKREWECEIY